jgi:transcriptional regulator with XRE-family HTH domain
MTGQQMRVARLNRGKSIRGLARDLDIPEQAIRRIEAGFGIRVDRAKKLADWHGVLVTDLPAFDPDDQQAAA